MKYMKLGTKPDTFYTEEATRSVTSDVPTDLVIRVNNITFLLHKYTLIPKCGLLQRLCTKENDKTAAVDLHDIPGGEDAFEICAKFCYGISIDLSAHNFVAAYCAAKFLRMTEAVEEGNLVMKLEVFFSSCVLEGWKDSLVALQSTANLPEWSENLGIIRRCIDSVVEKILIPRSQVKWKYTYTRPGFSKKQQLSVAPKDWWTEDISDLDLDVFRCIIMTVRSTGKLPSQLIGEALHVYACRWLPSSSASSSSSSHSLSLSLPSSSSSEHTSEVENKRRILETIVSLIPIDERSVSVGFLIRLLSLATNSLGASPVTKSQLVRQTSLQLDEAEVNDLMIGNDIDLIKVVLESYLELWRRRQLQAEVSEEEMHSLGRVAKLIDSYLREVAKDTNITATKLASLAEALPDSARPRHDDLYKAINTYLKEHPDMTKSEKKQLCRILNCQKLSTEMRAHAVKNERLPLRTVVQVLFYEQEEGKMTPVASVASAREDREIRMEGLNEQKMKAGNGKLRPSTR